MKALVSPDENNRIAQVGAESFEIAEPLFWVDCPDYVTTEWVYVDGAFLAPVPPMPVIPSEVSMLQVRLALFRQGLLTKVQTSIKALAEPQKSITQISWEYATIVHRDDALMTALFEQLGLNSEALDAFFTLAATL